MGERLLCKQEVIGSIPFTSTSLRCASAEAAAPKRVSAKAGWSRGSRSYGSASHVGGSTEFSTQKPVVVRLLCSEL